MFHPASQWPLICHAALGLRRRRRGEINLVSVSWERIKFRSDRLTRFIYRIFLGSIVFQEDRGGFLWGKENVIYSCREWKVLFVFFFKWKMMLHKEWLWGKEQHMSLLANYGLTLLLSYLLINVRCFMGVGPTCGWLQLVWIMIPLLLNSKPLWSDT